MKTKVSWLFLCFVLFSYCHNPTLSTDVANAISEPIKNGDTIFKSSDTLILKNNLSFDTLIKYRAVGDSSYYVEPVNLSYTGILDFSAYEFKKDYKTIVKEGVLKHGTNFAGHFCFVYWGCGSPCKLSAVIDLKTGRVYNGIAAGTGYRFKKNSCLLVVNPPDSTNWYHAFMAPEEFVWSVKALKK